MNAWLEDAACAGMDTERFAVGRNMHADNGKIRQALNICHQCPVQAECRTDMLLWPTPPYRIVIAGLDPRAAFNLWVRTNPDRQAYREQHRRKTA